MSKFLTATVECILIIFNSASCSHCLLYRLIYCYTSDPREDLPAPKISTNIMYQHFLASASNGLCFRNSLLEILKVFGVLMFISSPSIINFPPQYKYINYPLLLRLLTLNQTSTKTLIMPILCYSNNANNYQGTLKQVSLNNGGCNYNNDVRLSNSSRIFIVCKCYIQHVPLSTSEIHQSCAPVSAAPTDSVVSFVLLNQSP